MVAPWALADPATARIQCPENEVFQCGYHTHVDSPLPVDPLGVGAQVGDCTVDLKWDTRPTGTKLEVEVRDAQGNPIPGATVNVTWLKGGDPNVPPVDTDEDKTDEDGRATFAATVDADKVRYKVTVPGPPPCVVTGGRVVGE